MSNKTEISAEIARDTPYTNVCVGTVIDLFLGKIIRDLKEGDTVKISGFGTLKVKVRKTKSPLNGKLQEYVTRYIQFTPGKKIREHVINETPPQQQPTPAEDRGNLDVVPS